jgi:hypothetical protein
MSPRTYSIEHVGVLVEPTVSFTLRPIYPRERASVAHWIGDWQSRSRVGVGSHCPPFGQYGIKGRAKFSPCQCVLY